MKLCPDFELEEIDGKHTVCTKNGDRIALNDTMAFLFMQLKQGEKTKEQLLHLLLDNFDISTVLALNNIDTFVKTLMQNGIIEE